MLIEAYLDESGIHEGAKLCVVAGFYGTQAAWKKFNREWQAVVAENGLSEQGFHAKEFFHRKQASAYKEWTEERAEKFLDRLLQCILRNRIFPIGHAVLVDDFRALPLIQRQWHTGAKFRKSDGKYLSGGCPTKAYYLPFQFSALKSAALSQANSVDKINFFVGSGRPFHGYATKLFQYFLVDDRLPPAIRAVLGTIDYPLGKQTPGIQAADLLCYEIYRTGSAKLKDPNCNPSALLMRLLRHWRGKRELLLINSTVFEKMEQQGQAAYDRLMKQKEFV